MAGRNLDVVHCLHGCTGAVAFTNPTMPGGSGASKQGFSTKRSRTVVFTVIAVNE
jgi:hypothetical protein